MRIVFLGLPLAALSLLKAQHPIELAVLCRAHVPGTRRLIKHLGHSRVFVRPQGLDENLIKQVQSLEPDCIISWFWTKKLPIELIRSAKRLAFGVHPSLLPRWRGPDPYFWALDSGDVQTGVTAHTLEAEYDTGNILGQIKIDILPSWNAWTLARALDRPSLQLLLELTQKLAQEQMVQDQKQEEANATYAPMPDESMLAIHWAENAASIVCRIRAAAPYPGAWTFINDHALVITRAEIAIRPTALTCGEAMIISNTVVVAAADHGVALLEGRRIDDDDHEHYVDAAAIAQLMTVNSHSD